MTRKPSESGKTFGTTIRYPASLEKKLDEAKSRRGGRMFVLNPDNLEKWGVKE